MNHKFEQISVESGFMKHNGGLLFKTISENEYEFKTTIKENHLNAAGITHGGFIAAFVDAGAGTAAHRSAESNPCVTVSLELKFISTVRLGQELIGKTKIQKKFTGIDGCNAPQYAFPLKNIAKYLNVSTLILG